MFSKKSIPEIIYHIDDYDRQQKKFSETDNVIIALSTFPKTPEQWEIVFDTPTEVLAKMGSSMLMYQAVLVDNILLTKRMVWMEGYEIPIVSGPDGLMDQILDRLTEDHPFAVGYFDMPGGRKYSVRSRKGAVSALEIAKKFNGGGHETAAAFFLPLKHSYKVFKE